MAKRPRSKKSNAYEAVPTTRRGAPAIEITSNGWIKTTEQREVTLRTVTVERYASPPPPGVSSDAPSDQEHPDELLDAVLSAVDRTQYLLHLAYDVWMPRAWREYRAAGLEVNVFVWIHGPDGGWQPETANIEGIAVPAWRLPSLHEFKDGDAAWIAGELLQIACLVAEQLDSEFPRLRERFALMTGQVEPLHDLAVLVAQAGCFYAALVEFDTMPGHPKGATLRSAAETGKAVEQPRIGKLDSWARPAVVFLQEQIDNGAHDTTYHLAGLLRGFPDAPNEHKSREAAVRRFKEAGHLKLRSRDNSPQPTHGMRRLPPRP